MSRVLDRGSPSFADRQAGYVTALLCNASAMQVLLERRGWTQSAIAKLGIGYDVGTGRVTLPMRVDRELVGHLRYSPAGEVPKMLAEQGVPRTLFPEPETLASEDWVFVVEGEPDAVAAHSIGLTAVGVPGVHGWRDEYAPRFTGRSVAVITDTDDEGRALAARLATSLTPVASRFVALDLEEIAEKTVSVISGANDLTDAVLCIPGRDRAGFGEYLVGLAEQTASSCDESDESDESPTSVAVVASVAVAPPSPLVYHGLAGRIVRAIEPHSEADPIGVLISFLVGFGNAVGRGPHVLVGRSRHGCNLQAVLVGDSSTARKGTAWDDARWLLALAEPEWVRTRD